MVRTNWNYTINLILRSCELIVAAARPRPLPAAPRVFKGDSLYQDRLVEISA